MFGFITVFAGLLASRTTKSKNKKYGEAITLGFGVVCYSAWLVIYCCRNVGLPSMRPLFVLGKWVSILMLWGF